MPYSSTMLCMYIYIYNPMMGTSTLASRHPWAVPVPWTTSLELRQTAGRLKSHIEISFWLVISNMFYFPIIYGIILTIDLIFFKMLKTTNESWNIMPKPMVGLECYNATLIVIHWWWYFMIIHDNSRIEEATETRCFFMVSVSGFLCPWNRSTDSGPVTSLEAWRATGTSVSSVSARKTQLCGWTATFRELLLHLRLV